MLVSFCRPEPSKVMLAHCAKAYLFSVIYLLQFVDCYLHIKLLDYGIFSRLANLSIVVI